MARGLTPLEIVEAAITFVTLYLESMIHAVHGHHVEPTAAPHRLSRRMGHQRPIYPGEGLMFLCCLNLVAAMAIFGVFVFRGNNMRPGMLVLHFFYCSLTGYCATLEFLGVAIGYGERWIPFDLFPIVVTGVVLLGICLECMWIVTCGAAPAQHPALPPPLMTPTTHDPHHVVEIVNEAAAESSNLDANNPVVDANNAGDVGAQSSSSSLRRRAGSSSSYQSATSSF